MTDLIKITQVFTNHIVVYNYAMDLHNFKQLEDKINKLIEQNTSLKEQNKIFLRKLGQMDRDIQKLNDHMKKLNEERNLVYTKVDDIIERLEGLDLSD